jgi:hypothetical protein
VQQAEPEGAAVAGDAERCADRLGGDVGLVDHEAVAVVAPHRADLLQAEVGEQAAVEVGDLALAPAGGRVADDVVLDVVAERGQEAVEVALDLGGEVVVDEGVEVGGCRGDAHGASRRV